MKKILKCLSCFICMVLCMFSLSACGEKEEVYSNMTKSGFSNYLTNENTKAKFSNFELSVVEKLNNSENFYINIKTRTLSGKSISAVTYKKGGINAEIYIAQDKVYFRFKNASDTEIETHAITLDFYATTNFTSVATANVNEKIILNEIYNYLVYADANTLYTKIKDDTDRLEVSYSIQMAIKNNYDKYKLNYSANEESGTFAEEYSVNTYLEFKSQVINKVEYVKVGRQIDNTSFSNYELKITAVGYGETINFPGNIDEYPVD